MSWMRKKKQKWIEIFTYTKFNLLVLISAKVKWYHFIFFIHISAIVNWYLFTTSKFSRNYFFRQVNEKCHWPFGHQRKKNWWPMAIRWKKAAYRVDLPCWFTGKLEACTFIVNVSICKHSPGVKRIATFS